MINFRYSPFLPKFFTRREYLNPDQIFGKLEEKIVRRRKWLCFDPEGGSNGLGAIRYAKAIADF